MRAGFCRCIKQLRRCLGSASTESVEERLPVCARESTLCVRANIRFDELDLFVESDARVWLSLDGRMALLIR